MWSNKKLWGLGALALIDSATGLFRIWFVQLVLLFAQDLFQRDISLIAQNGLSLLAGIVLTAGLIAISVVAFAGLISGYDQVDITGTLSLSKLWNDARRSFGRLLAIELAWSLALFLISGKAISLNWLAQLDWLDWFQCILGPMVCFSWIVSLILSLTVYLANYAVVMDNLSLLDAVRNAWKIIRNFYGAFIPIGILFFFVGWAFVVYQAGMTMLVAIGLGPLIE